MNVLYSLLAFAVAIGVLVTVHEFGHFWVAHRLGVKVLRFSIGFGRPLWTRRAGADQTEYVLAAVPLGGYVKMLDEREGEVPPEEAHRAFNRQPLAVRSAVVVAGPLFNFLFALVAYWAMFMIGVSGVRPVVDQVTPGSVMAAAGLQPGDRIVAVDGRVTDTWQDVIQAVLSEALDRGTARFEVKTADGRQQALAVNLHGVGVDQLTRGRFFTRLGLQPERPQLPPIIGHVESGGPAARAGLQAGDRVIAADGQPIETWEDWVKFVRAHPAQTVQVDIERSGRRQVLELRPEAVSAEQRTRSPFADVLQWLGVHQQHEQAGKTHGFIGAAASTAALKKYYVTDRRGPLYALQSSFSRTYEMSALTLRMFWKMLTLQVSVANLSGPISIAQYAGYSAEIGVSRFLEFLAIVSVSLGILNLLPIPILDGGHLLYYFIELFKGRPLSEEAQLAAQRVGIAMLVGLMGLAFYNDLARLFG